MNKATSMPRLKTGWMRSGQAGREGAADQPDAGLRPERVLARGEVSNLVLARPDQAGEGGRLQVFKTLRTDRELSSAVLARFNNELYVAIRVKGPGLLDGSVDKLTTGEPGVRMPWVDGPDLVAFLLECERRGRVPRLAALLRIALTVGEALVVLHRGGEALPPLCHGSVQPGNVLLSGEGDCWLIDFGQARQLSEHPDGARQDLRSFGGLLAALRAGTLPDSPHSWGGPGVSEEHALGRLFDRIAARCLVSPDNGGFADVAAFLASLRDALDSRAIATARSALVDELELLFGSRRSGAGYRGGPFRPPLLPMVVSWLPPVPRSAAVDPVLSAESESPDETDQETAAVDSVRSEAPVRSEPPPRSKPPAPPKPPRAWAQDRLPAEARETDEMSAPGLVEVGATQRQSGYPLRVSRLAARRGRSVWLMRGAMVAFLIVGVVVYWLANGSRVGPGAPADDPTLVAGVVAEAAPEPAAEVTPAPTEAAPVRVVPDLAPKVRPPTPASTPARAVDPTPRPSRTVKVEAASSVAPTPQPVAEPTPEVVEVVTPDGLVVLTVATNPPGAIVTVNSRSLGASPVEVRVPPHENVKIHTELDGYVSSTKFHRMGETDGTKEIRLRKD